MHADSRIELPRFVVGIGQLDKRVMLTHRYRLRRSGPCHEPSVRSRASDVNVKMVSTSVFFGKALVRGR